LNLFRLDYWRHFVQEADAGGGGDIGDSPIDPATDPGGGPGYGLPPGYPLFPPPAPPAPPAPGPGGGSNYYGPAYAARTSSPPPPPPKPPGPLDGIPQERVAQIQDLVNQWEQMVGFSATVSDQLIAQMAKNYGMTDIFDIAQYLKANLGSSWANMAQQPWAWYGMSATEYNSHLAAYRSVWSQLTGTELPGNDGNNNIVDQALKQFQGQMSENQFQQWLLSQDNIKNTYGWLKYGLNFNQFEQQKLGMNLAFGRTLSDTEGVTQLQYLHSASGPLMSIANQPTFTQQERKQANVGISGVVAR